MTSGSVKNSRPRRHGRSRHQAKAERRMIARSEESSFRTAARDNLRLAVHGYEIEFPSRSNFYFY